MALCDPDGPWSLYPTLTLDDLEEFLGDFTWEA